MPQIIFLCNNLFINSLQQNFSDTQIVENCGNHKIFAQYVEIWGFYKYTNPVLLWRGKGNIVVFTSGWTCFLRNCW